MGKDKVHRETDLFGDALEKNGCNGQALKFPCDQKINSYFSLDSKTMLTKH